MAKIIFTKQHNLRTNEQVEAFIVAASKGTLVLVDTNYIPSVVEKIYQKKMRDGTRTFVQVAFVDL